MNGSNRKVIILTMDNDALTNLIAANLKAVLQAKGLNASAWAKAAGMGHTGVRDIIEKKVRNPTYRTLVSLAHAARVDIRAITVSPDYADLPPDDVEALLLLSQLEPQERQILLGGAQGMIDARRKTREVKDEGQS